MVHQPNIPAPRNFILLVLGQIVSVFGSSLLRFALSLYVLDLTGRADIFATLIALSNVPLLLSPLGGALADRFNRRNLIVLYDFAGSAVILGFIALLPAVHSPVPLIAVVMILLAVVGAMYTPAVLASIPLLVRKEKLEQANGIVNGVQALSGVASPVVGGILYSWAGLTDMIVISGLVFFLSAIMEMFIHMPFAHRVQQGPFIRSIGSDLKAGFKYVAGQPYMFKTMILAALLNFILTPFFIIGGPAILRITMHCSDAMYGAGMGLIEFAIILGALSAGLFARRLRLNKLYKWLLLIALLLVPIAAAVTPTLLEWSFSFAVTLFMLCAVIVALLLTVLSVYVIALVQKQTPDAHLGKVMAILMAASQCAAPAGQLLFGLLFERFSAVVYIPVLVISLLMAGTALAARRMLRHEEGIA